MSASSYLNGGGYSDYDSKSVDRLEERSSFYDYGGHHYGHHDCCPLVVDPLTFLCLLCAILGATYFLNVVITMSIVANNRRRRRRRRRRRGAGGTVEALVGDVFSGGTDVSLCCLRTVQDSGVGKPL